VFTSNGRKPRLIALSFDGPRRGCTNLQRPRRQGFGTELMQAMIVSQLRGTITFNWHAEGLASEIVIPAAT
jgi:two-component sensor histidine kinase